MNLKCVLILSMLLASSLADPVFANVADRHAYVATGAGTQNSTLHRVNLNGLENHQTWDLGGPVRGFALTSDGRYAYMELERPPEVIRRLVRWNIALGTFDRDYGPSSRKYLNDMVATDIHLFHDETRLAYRTEDGIAVLDLETGQSQIILTGADTFQIIDEDSAGPYLLLLPGSVPAPGAPERRLLVFDARDQSMRLIDAGEGNMLSGAHFIKAEDGSLQLWILYFGINSKISRLDLENGQELDVLLWEPTADRFIRHLPPRLALHPNLDRYCVLFGTELECRHLSDGQLDQRFDSDFGLTWISKGPSRAFSDHWIVVDSGQNLVNGCFIGCIPSPPAGPVNLYRVDLQTGAVESRLLGSFVAATFRGSNFVTGEPSFQPIPATSLWGQVLAMLLFALTACWILTRGKASARMFRLR